MRALVPALSSIAAAMLLGACGSEEGNRPVVPPSTFDSGLPLQETAPRPDTGTPPPGDTSIVMDTGAPTDTGTPMKDAMFVDVPSTKDTSIDAVPLIDGDLPPDEDTGPAFDSAAPDASPAIVPVGKVCSTNAECDPGGGGAGVCSSTRAAPDTVDPQPTCMATTCGGAGVGKPCGAGGAGVCINGGFACVDACSFGASGAASGCAGKTGCNVVSYARESGGVKGVGSCGGGCTMDADCSSGQKCHPETGRCVATVTLSAKAFGASCTSTSECPCQFAAGKTGYCSRACVTGGPACPTGYTCDSGLPKTDATGTLFSSAPSGLVGECLKNCSSDADCTAHGAVCDTNTATGVKVCRVP